MTYLESLLANGETIVYTTKKHWIAPLFASVTGTLLVVAGIAALFGQLLTDNSFLDNVFLWGGILALIVGAAMLAHAFVQWWAQYYFVTNQKVMKVEGILRKSTSGSALEKINDITMEVPLLGRWLGFGTLRVLTAADESNLNYTVMRQPAEFRKVILDQKLLFEQADARTIADAVRGTAPLPPAQPAHPAQTEASAPSPVERSSPDEIADAIERLAQLRTSGAITQEEFDAKKAELLERM